MTNRKRIQHVFVEFIPSSLAEDTLYISLPYATVAHRCFCGCGEEVNTPLSPTDWMISFNGIAVSLDPSIGNWSFACQSHYWVTNNTVIPAPRWSKERIRKGRAYDAVMKDDYFSASPSPTSSEAVEPSHRISVSSWANRMRKRLGL